MNNGFVDWIWHGLFRRPYSLTVQIDEGKGTPIVFLHGIASDYHNWLNVIEPLTRRHRCIAVDLLGHGSSPKPLRSKYTATDHARAVVRTLEKLGVTKPVMLVGHSMGAIIAVEVAKLQPKKVSQLVLCGMPIYESSSNWRIASSTNTYFALYRLMLKRPEFTLKSAALAMKMLAQRSSFTLTQETWHGFKCSLENTIIKQTTYKDIKRLQLPILLVRGKFDMLAPAKPLATLAKTMPNVTMFEVNQPHEMTKAYAVSLAQKLSEL